VDRSAASLYVFPSVLRKGSRMSTPLLGTLVAFVVVIATVVIAYSR
jgi:hypothetical protein